MLRWSPYDLHDDPPPDPPGLPHTVIINEMDRLPVCGCWAAEVTTFMNMQAGLKMFEVVTPNPDCQDHGQSPYMDEGDITAGMAMYTFRGQGVIDLGEFWGENSL